VTVVLSARDELDLRSLDEHTEGSEEGPAKAHAFKSLDKRVRLASIDNFQGEESKVVIVSLVRSNERGQLGFLSVLNRVNVLLSRAMHGMYLIGNADCLRSCRRDNGLWVGTPDTYAIFTPVHLMSPGSV